ncbi:MAG: Lin1244/Lin1753 domain-containing protein [Bacteroidota bacterium]
MKWFKHDCMASLDPRLSFLAKDHGVEGLGIYWILLEEMGRLSNTLHLKIQGLSPKADRNFEALKDRCRRVRIENGTPKPIADIPVYPAEILGNRAFTAVEKVKSVIGKCVDVGLFDEVKWTDYGILSSRDFASMADEYTRKCKRSDPEQRVPAIELMDWVPARLEHSPDSLAECIEHVRTTPERVRTPSDSVGPEQK